MNVYWCYFVTDDEWGCFVIAPSRGRAKTLFLEWFKFYIGGYGEFTDIRCLKRKEVPADMDWITERVIDCPEPILDHLGVGYAYDADFEEMKECDI